MTHCTWFSACFGQVPVRWRRLCDGPQLSKQETAIQRFSKAANSSCARKRFYIRAGAAVHAAYASTLGVTYSADGRLIIHTAPPLEIHEIYCIPPCFWDTSAALDAEIFTLLPRFHPREFEFWRLVHWFEAVSFTIVNPSEGIWILAPGALVRWLSQCEGRHGWFMESTGDKGAVGETKEVDVEWGQFAALQHLCRELRAFSWLTPAAGSSKTYPQPHRLLLSLIKTPFWFISYFDFHWKVSLLPAPSVDRWLFYLTSFLAILSAFSTIPEVRNLFQLAAPFRRTIKLAAPPPQPIKKEET